MQMAVRASVTVSMAEDRMGIGQADAGGQVGGDVHVPRQHVALGGDQQHIVECEGLSQMTFGQHLGRLAECPPTVQCGL